MRGKLWRWMTLTDSSVISLTRDKQCHIYAGTMQQHRSAQVPVLEVPVEYYWERIHFICEVMTKGMANHVSTWIFRGRREVADLFHQDGVGDEFLKALSSVDMIGKRSSYMERSRLLIEPVPSELLQSTDRLFFFVCRCRITAKEPVRTIPSTTRSRVLIHETKLIIFAR
jgi:hypothetical protein